MVLVRLGGYQWLDPNSTPQTLLHHAGPGEGMKAAQVKTQTINPTPYYIMCQFCGVAHATTLVFPLTSVVFEGHAQQQQHVKQSSTAHDASIRRPTLVSAFTSSCV